MNTTMKTLAAAAMVCATALAAKAAEPSYPIKTMTDLGGKTYSSGSKTWANLVGNGGGIKNGTLNAEFSSWWTHTDVTFTIGKGGKFYTPLSNTGTGSDADKKGEMNFGNNAKLIIDGGEVYNQNRRGGENTTTYGHYLADKANQTSEIRITDGGLFKSAYLFVRVAQNGTGTISIDNGTLNVADGKKTLIVGTNSGAVPTLAVTNGTIKAGDVQFCESASTVVKATFVNSTLNITKMYKTKDPTASGSYVIMDGCTINSSLSSGDLLGDLGTIPYQLKGKGLTVNTANDTSVKGQLVGDGGLTKKGAGTLALAGKSEYKGATVVEAGAVSIPKGKTLAGAVEVKSGGKLMISGLSSADVGKAVATFNGGLTLADGATLADAYNPFATFELSADKKQVLLVKYPALFSTITFSGYKGGETLTDFPALIKLEEGVNGFSYGQCKGDGSDIYFEDASGNVLASEIDTWDTAGASLIWVRVPTLTAATTIRMCWGGATAPAASADSVWTEDYLLIYHFNNWDPTKWCNDSLPGRFSNGAPNLDDGSGKVRTGYSDAYINDSKYKKGGSLDNIYFKNPASVIGKGWYSSGSGADGAFMKFERKVTTSRTWARSWEDFTETGKHTVSFWMKSDEAAANLRLLGAKKAWNDSLGGFEITTRNTNGKDILIGGAGKNQITATGTDSYVDGYVYVTVVWDKPNASTATRLDVYLNGVNKLHKQDDNYKPTTSTEASLVLAQAANGGSQFAGYIDEFRTAKVAFSADRVKADYDTAKTPTTFAVAAAVAPERDPVALTWQGADGDDWWGADKWLYQGENATFGKGDTAVFAGLKAASESAVVSRTTMTGGIVSSNNVEIAGTAGFSAPKVEVIADKTVSISAKFTGSVEKNGAGTLELKDLQGSGGSVKVNAGTLKLTGAPSDNPFTSMAIKGVLDLGGATQTLDTGNNTTGILCNGGELRNGTLNLNFTEYWWSLATTFTVGPGATLATLPDGHKERCGEMNFKGGSRMIIDGGTFVNQNNRNVADYGNHIGVDNATKGEIRIVNGGTFKSKYKFVRVGVNKGATGTLSIDGGTVNVADGAQELCVAQGFSDDTQAATGIAALTNATVLAKALVVGGGKATNTAKVTLKDSVANVERIYANGALADGSFILFDNATLAITGSQADIIAANNLPPVTIAAGGLTISNANDTAISAPLTGTGALVKTGAGQLTVGGTPSFTGGITVKEGDIALGGTMPESTLTAADGTKVTATLTADGFTTRNMALALDPKTEGKVMIVAAGTLEPGESYTLFKKGTLTEETLARLEPFGSYYFEFDEDTGDVNLVATMQAFVWRGAAASDTWSLAGNWQDATIAPKRGAEIVFDGGTGHSTYDLADGLILKNITATNGVRHTVDVANAAFAPTPVTVAADSVLALENASGKTNLFTATSGSTIAGALDLGGASQTFDFSAAAPASGIDLRNGNIDLDFTGWWWVSGGKKVTIGKGATAYTPASASGSTAGEMNLQSGGELTIDGGTLVNRNNRGESTGHYVGCDAAGTATIRVINGGTFKSENLFVRIGYNCKVSGESSTGVLAVTNGTVNVADGNQQLRVACATSTKGIVACSNATLTAKNLLLCESSSSVAEMTFVDSTLNVDDVMCNGSRKVATGSFVIFDGTTLSSKGGKMPLADIGIPYQIVGKGLAINAYATYNTNSVVGALKGDGPLVLNGGTKVLAITGDASAYTGTVNVTNGWFFSDRTFGGGLTVVTNVALDVDSGILGGGSIAVTNVTLDVGSATFGGDVTIPAGVKFAGVDPTQEQPEYYKNPKVLVKTKGEIDAKALYGLKSEATHNRFFTVGKDGWNYLYYGHREGFLLIVK